MGQAHSLQVSALGQCGLSVHAWYRHMYAAARSPLPMSPAASLERSWEESTSLTAMPPFLTHLISPKGPQKIAAPLSWF